VHEQRRRPARRAASGGGAERGVTRVASRPVVSQGGSRRGMSDVPARLQALTSEAQPSARYSPLSVCKVCCTMLSSACRTPLALAGAAGFRRAARAAVRAVAPRAAAPGTRSSQAPASSLPHRRGVAASATAGDDADAAAAAADAGLGPINKSVIQLTPRTYAYLLANTREPAALRACREATSGLHGSQMQVPPEQGALLALLVELSGARRALEVGTFTVRVPAERKRRPRVLTRALRAGLLLHRHRAGAAGRRRAGDVRRERGDDGRRAKHLGRSRRGSQGASGAPSACALATADPSCAVRVRAARWTRGWVARWRHWTRCSATRLQPAPSTFAS